MFFCHYCAQIYLRLKKSILYSIKKTLHFRAGLQMDDDDIENKKKQEYFCVNLTNFSKDELNEYIIFLEQEIKRTNKEISNKSFALGEANLLFKKKS
ncbi:MAG: hypothetical protein CMM49_02570 [Rhodospirillaceae bacterium]|nr:hypothetical protein [Rhodospirillaceae bacterium]